MDTKLKNKYKWNKFISAMLLICLIAAVLYTMRYPAFHSTAMKYYESPLEKEQFATDIYKSAYVLYRDLYEKVNQQAVSFEELYLDANIRQEKEIDIYYDYNYIGGNYRDSIGFTIEQYQDGLYGFTEEGREEEQTITQEAAKEYFSHRIMNQAEETFSGSFEWVSKVFDYYIVDNTTGICISNSSEDFSVRENFKYLVQIHYDENGNLGTVYVVSENPAAYMKTVTEVGRSGGGFHYYDFDDLEEASGIDFRLQTPKDCTITFGLTYEGYRELQNNPHMDNYSSEWEKYAAYCNAGMTGWLWLILGIVMLVAFILPMKQKIWEIRLFRLPFEGAVLLLWGLLEIGEEEIETQTILYCEGNIAENLGVLTGNAFWTEALAYFWNLFLVFFFFTAVAYAVLCLREMRSIGIREYLKQRSYIYRIFPYTKKKVKQAYSYLTHFDVSTDTNKVIIRLLIVNGILVSIFTLFWFGGIFAIVIYSIILYFILRKYLSDMKKKYEILLKATNQIAEGNLNVTITEELGMFEPFKPQIEKIQEGFKTAVEEEVKSQRMKTELITNVSHDLKTPLTAIITYINLLKEDGVTEEERKEYLDTLERKSLRLKVLIEDLFEVSKANSKNINLNPVDVDIVDLIKQVNFELEENIKAAGLDIRFQSSEERIILKLDSQKTYRIYENLVGNVAKYALPNTRVYMSVEKQANRVIVEIKNISASEIGFAPEELTERFVRGDTSRNTEGSGLGLAIAKSFAQLQGGKMEICLDGDLFKVITEWPIENV